MKRIRDWLLGKRVELSLPPPPREEIFHGRGDFQRVGEEFFRFFVEVGGLQPSEKVLEIGCGVGRMAAPLTHYLTKKGSYTGVDIVADGIAHCQKTIASRYANFQFLFIDVYNKFYNPGGQYQASSYQFPFADESFDFIFLTSVFTHMLPQDVENYLAEIARLLRPHGRCFITFFLLNIESLRRLEEKSATEVFPYVFDRYRVTDQDTPEAVIAHEEELVRGLYGKYQLKIQEPICYGSWCGRKDFLSYQDIVLAVKE
jgi:SAM-dependent methyltransferase